MVLDKLQYSDLTIQWGNPNTTRERVKKQKQNQVLSWLRKEVRTTLESAQRIKNTYVLKK